LTFKVKPDTLGGATLLFYCMEKILTLPQSLYLFKSSASLLQDTLEKVKGIAWKQNVHNYISQDLFLQKQYQFKEISEWIRECILEVKDELEYVCEDFRITQMWATKTTFKQSHHTHKHTNTIISGIYYLTDSNAETWFSIPSIWDDDKNCLDKHLRLCYADDHGLRPLHVQPSIAGNLLIFPSNLYHSVNEHLIDPEPRYVMAFNSFPSGQIGKYDYYSGITLDVK